MLEERARAQPPPRAHAQRRGTLAGPAAPALPRLAAAWTPPDQEAAVSRGLRPEDEASGYRDHQSGGRSMPAGPQVGGHLPPMPVDLRTVAQLLADPSGVLESPLWTELAHERPEQALWLPDPAFTIALVAAQNDLATEGANANTPKKGGRVWKLRTEFMSKFGSQPFRRRTQGT